MLKVVDKDSDAVCGIARGGVYYASVIADLLNKPLLILNPNDLVEFTENYRNIAVIDDVYATGKTYNKVNALLAGNGCTTKCYIIFNYLLFDENFYVNNNLQYILNIYDLCKAARALGILSQKDIYLLKKQLAPLKLATRNL